MENLRSLCSTNAIRIFQSVIRGNSLNRRFFNCCGRRCSQAQITSLEPWYFKLETIFLRVLLVAFLYDLDRYLLMDNPRSF
jgi:hypothetical protein